VSVVSTQIDIDAPPEEVWALVTDPSRTEDWVTIHRAMKSHSDGKPRVGYEMKQTLCLRGAKFDVSWTAAEVDAPRHLKWEGRGPARSHASTEYRLTPYNGGTRFDYRNEFKAPLGPLGAMASRALVGGVPEKEANASLARLKKLLER